MAEYGFSGYMKMKMKVTDEEILDDINTGCNTIAKIANKHKMQESSISTRLIILRVNQKIKISGKAGLSGLQRVHELR